MEYILVIAIAIICFIGGYVLAKILLKQEEREVRKDAVKRSRAVLAGQFSEQLAPYLPGFDHDPNEVKFIGKPVDFIAFKGLSAQAIEEVVFVEVKSGNSKLSKTESSLKKAIENGNVSYQEYKIPEEVTRGKA
jgi:predicted Holliday junction resolvase-like endonuclease